MTESQGIIGKSLFVLELKKVCAQGNVILRKLLSIMYSTI